jgi:hypothetical protein
MKDHSIKVKARCPKNLREDWRFIAPLVHDLLPNLQDFALRMTSPGLG